MHQHTLEPGAPGRTLPRRAHGIDPDGLAVLVKHIQAVPRSPAPVEQRLERRRQAEREDAELAALRFFEPDPFSPPSPSRTPCVALSEA